MAAQNRYQRVYYCTRCGNPTDRDKLTAKKSVFTGMGSQAKTHKSRVTAHLCPNCLKGDRDWNLEPYAEPDFEVLPAEFRDEPEDAQSPDQLELDLEPAHLLEQRRPA